MRNILAVCAALVLIGLGVFLLERSRAGLEILDLRVGDTPATLMQRPGAVGPVVVIAHGFAGSRQLMHPYQITLARAGYLTVSFDFQGHGRNPVPMSGDVNALDGTTQLLMAEMGRVTDAALALDGADGRVALLGHSMASDIVVRQALADPRVEAVVAVSLFSRAVTDKAPMNLLAINGAWEGALRAEARRIMAEVGAQEGETTGHPGKGFARRAVAAPMAEHVGVLYSGTGLAEARDWLNLTFDRGHDSDEATIGGPILLTLIGVVLLGLPLAQIMPAGHAPPEIPPGAFWTLAIAPAILTPLVLSPFRTQILPVLVADYLALHLALYGGLVLVGLTLIGRVPKRAGWWAGLVLAGFGLLAFGGMLDRYVASFYPHTGRLPILAAILPGAVLAMVADAALLQAGHARMWRRLAVRLAVLASLGLAVALNPERLFFLVLILPVIALFYFSFGVIGGAVGRRMGSVMAMGLGLGVILAWALSVTFPLFQGAV
ncbi:MAG: alpha/beta fold hydrolase [Rhodobacteraceae bacterium]|nr:alpha/beta fold hydrolase [Paracoccaceae bacterium]